MAVLLVSQPAGFVLLLGLALFVPGRADGSALLQGGLAGLAATGALLLLYAGLAAGPMSLVAPVTAVASAVVPVVFGLGAGERPPPAVALAVALALLSVVLVSQAPSQAGAVGGRADGRRGVLLALAAGACFGTFAIVISRTDDGSGLWPLIAARGVGAVVVVTTVAALRLRAPRGPGLGMAFAAGLLDALGNVGYLVAVRSGPLTVAAVLVALYPAATVLLARLVLGERTTVVQRAGMVGAAISVALIAAYG
ncbi:MAG: DMT family transporter [Actinomycetota bacterium]|nr:DMT family transporter [Actinomycetota bacterium]